MDNTEKLKIAFGKALEICLLGSRCAGYFIENNKIKECSQGVFIVPEFKADIVEQHQIHIEEWRVSKRITRSALKPYFGESLFSNQLHDAINVAALAIQKIKVDIEEGRMHKLVNTLKPLIKNLLIREIDDWFIKAGFSLKKEQTLMMTKTSPAFGEDGTSKFFLGELFPYYEEGAFSGITMSVRFKANLIEKT